MVKKRTMTSEALVIAKELYNELYVEREHSDMQKYKLEELIEALGGEPDEYIRLVLEA